MIRVQGHLVLLPDIHSVGEVTGEGHQKVVLSSSLQLVTNIGKHFSRLSVNRCRPIVTNVISR